MAACPRADIVRPGEVGVYHCWNRCVRRAWLCGRDPCTGHDYDYRRDWIQTQQQLLARLFAIEIAFHAEMSNHIHLVLRTRPDVVQTWSDEEVVRRWLRITRLKRGHDETAAEPTEAQIQLQLARPGRADQLRRRLSSVSWFMAALCENIARRSNQEDGCRGKFWESRYGCRDLADDAAILVSGIYVDLNPIRAGEADRPEAARHTSAYDRIRARNSRLQAAGGVSCCAAGHVPAPCTAGEAMPADGWLCELTLQEGPTADVRDGVSSRTPWRASDKGILPVGLDDYLKILDWTGRQLRSGRSAAIPADLAPILQRLRIRVANWLETIERFDRSFRHIVAPVEQIAAKAARIGRRWLFGMEAAAQAFT